MQQAVKIMKSDPVDYSMTEEIAFSTMTSFHDRLGTIMCAPIECEADMQAVNDQLCNLTTDMQAFCNSFLEGHTRAQPGIFGNPLHFAEGAQAATA